MADQSEVEILKKVFKAELHRATSSIIEYLKNEQTSEEVLLANLDNLRDYMDESLVTTGKSNPRKCSGRYLIGLERPLVSIDVKLLTKFFLNQDFY